MLSQVSIQGAEGNREEEQRLNLMPVPRRKKIMVIDDDIDHRLIIAEMLVNAGYTVMTAKDGEVGINTLLHSADKPDLIILDLFMPEKDGLAFRKEQKEIPSLAKIPVIFLSGQGLVEGETCLMKPVDERIVLNTVEEVLSRASEPRGEE